MRESGIAIVALVFLLGPAAFADVGQAKFDKICSSCHGSEGRADTKKGKKLKAADYREVARRITERKRREEEIRRLNASLMEQVEELTRELAEKVDQLARANTDLQKLDRMRSEFVSLVSHQLRAPLTNMRGVSEHIGANCDVMNSTCVRMLVILNQQVERLDGLVRDVLNAARIESGDLRLHPEPISVLPVIGQVVEQMRARAEGRNIRIPDTPGLPLVYADRDRLAEALVNLLDNADKYSPPGKDIVIEVRANEVEVVLSVRDHQ